MPCREAVSNDPETSDLTDEVSVQDARKGGPGGQNFIEFASDALGNMIDVVMLNRGCRGGCRRFSVR